MSNNRKIGIIAWVLGLALCNVLLFCLERGMTSTFWIAFAFVWIAFVSALIFQVMTWKKSDAPDEQFLHIPAIAISFGYMVIQIPTSIIFSLGSSAIPYKAAIIVNFLLLVVAWLLVLGGLGGNNYIRKVNSRQKNHHTEL